jgi:hypothetical protein
MRNSVQCDIDLVNVTVSDSMLLPKAKGLSGPFSCLNEARYGIIWGAMGAARGCLDAAIGRSMTREVFGTPIVLPADASTPGRYTMSANSIRELFERYNLNVLEGAIMNPPDDQGRRTNHKSYGINQMRQMLEVGSLHVNENCVDFLKEAQNYYVDSQGRFSDPDDCIDSARYAILGCLQGLAEPWDNRTPQDRMRAQRNRLRQPDDSNKPAWKRSYNPQG